MRRPPLKGVLGLAALLAVGVLAATEPRPGPATAACPFREPAPMTASTAPADPSADPATPIWADEFDSPADAPIDPSRWFLQTGGLGWGEEELQAYTGSPTNVAYNGEGQLVITARREPGDGGAQYTSGRVSTCGTFEFNHGRVEARIQLPRGQGLWPAFWTYGAAEPWPENGEIDIMESINDMRRIEFNTHQPLPDGTDWELSTNSPEHPSGSWSGEYHVFAVDWTRDAIVYSVNGVDYATVTRADTPPDGRWVVDRSPQKIVLNLAVGGYPGSPDASTPLPAEMKIDYVRVYPNEDTVVSYQAD